MQKCERGGQQCVSLTNITLLPIKKKGDNNVFLMWMSCVFPVPLCFSSFHLSTWLSTHLEHASTMAPGNGDLSRHCTILHAHHSTTRNFRGKKHNWLAKET